MKIFWTISFCLLVQIASAQTRISGFYKGLITQNPGGLAQKYIMELNLTIDNQGNALGTSFFKLVDSDEIFVKYSFTGFLQGDKLILTENSIDEEQNKEGFYFCYKIMEMRVLRKGHTYILEGSWKSTNCPNATGNIKIKQEDIF